MLTYHEAAPEVTPFADADPGTAATEASLRVCKKLVAGFMIATGASQEPVEDKVEPLGLKKIKC